MSFCTVRGYTAGGKVGQKPRRPISKMDFSMPRGLLFLILLLIVVVGAMFFLSGRVGEVPTKTVEVEVSGSGNAQ